MVHADQSGYIIGHKALTLQTSTVQRLEYSTRKELLELAGLVVKVAGVVLKLAGGVLELSRLFLKLACLVLRLAGLVLRHEDLVLNLAGLVINLLVWSKDLPRSCIDLA